MSTTAFGELIARARNEVGIKPEELAKRLGRKSKATVYALESGQQEPTIKDLNVLARELHLSVEAMLLALGARINPPEAATLPHELVSLLLRLSPNEYPAVEAQALGQLARRGRSQRSTPPPPQRSAP